MNAGSKPGEYVPAKAMHGNSRLNILLVEDDASDALLAETALDGANIEYDMHTLRDGQDVLPYLCHKGKYHDKSRPDIMFLDLSLPAKDGFEVLADLAEQHERFSDLPIIILTGDTHCAFLKQSYGLKIAAYMAKPCTTQKMSTAIAAVARKSPPTLLT